MEEHYLLAHSVLLLPVPPCIYGGVPCACLIPTEARRQLWIPLELELQMVFNNCVGVGNRTWTL